MQFIESDVTIVSNVKCHIVDECLTEEFLDEFEKTNFILNECESRVDSLYNHVSKILAEFDSTSLYVGGIGEAEDINITDFDPSIKIFYEINYVSVDIL